MSYHVCAVVPSGVSTEEKQKYVTLMFYKMQLEQMLSQGLITYEKFVSRMDDESEKLGVTEEGFMEFFSNSISSKDYQ